MNMRLRIVAEGHSEELFCKRMVIPHLAANGVFATVSKIETSSMRKRPDIRFKGGIPHYSHLRKDVMNYLHSDSSRNLVVSTFVDFFHLPPDFPGISSMPPEEGDSQISHLERALGADIGDSRFVPYIQKYEFEAFLFVDMMKLAALYPNHTAKLARIVRSAEGKAPEAVNGGDATSPSNRILKEIPEHRWNKPKAVQILEEIGLPRLRSSCPHFNKWMEEIEHLGVGSYADENDGLMASSFGGRSSR